MSCPVAESCGGCPLMSLRACEQRELKLAGVRRELQLPDLAIAWVADTSRAYRRRVRMQVGQRGRPGFFNAFKRQDCGVLTPGLMRAIDAVCGLTLPNAQHLEVRAPDLDGRAGLFITPVPGRQVQAPDISDFVVGIATDGPWQRWGVTRDTWSYVPVDAFMQVHEQINRRMVEALVRGALRRGAQTFFDPFTGAGNHALGLAAAGIAGVAADRHEGAVHALAVAAHEQRLPVRTIVGCAVDTASSGTAPFDLLVANPPRAGLREAAPVLATLGGPHVVLVMCTAVALARDLRTFETHGYALSELTAFDMFPQTDHVELVAWLRRR